MRGSAPSTYTDFINDDGTEILQEVLEQDVVVDSRIGAADSEVPDVELERLLRERRVRCKQNGRQGGRRDEQASCWHRVLHSTACGPPAPCAPAVADRHPQGETARSMPTAANRHRPLPAP